MCVLVDSIELNRAHFIGFDCCFSFVVVVVDYVFVACDGRLEIFHEHEHDDAMRIN